MEPPPAVADSLARARPTDLVHLDRRGGVRSRARSRALAGMYWGLLSVLVGAEAWLGYEAFGVPGLSIATVLGGYVGWFATRFATLRRATRLTVSGDPAEAEARARRVAEGRLVPRRLRAQAWAVAGTAAALQEAPERALTHCRNSLRLWKRSPRALARSTRYGEVLLLTRLGRTAEAREAWTTLGDEVPAGEYLRLRHHTAELYLAFVEGRCDLDDDALHERASFALGLGPGAGLLALLAWAFERAGDDEMADLLRTEALDRHPGELLSRTMPDLQAWLDGEDPVRARVADAAATDDSDAELPWPDEAKRRRAR